MAENTKVHLTWALTLVIVVITMIGSLTFGYYNYNQFLMECMKTNSISECRSN